MTVVLRPTVFADLPAVVGEPLPHRVKCLTIEVDGEVLAIGGLGFRPDGTVFIFMQSKPEVREYPVTLHRAGLTIMREIERLGLKRVVAFPDPNVEASERWLKRLGFTPETINDVTVWMWQCTTSQPKPS